VAGVLVLGSVEGAVGGVGCVDGGVCVVLVPPAGAVAPSGAVCANKADGSKLVVMATISSLSKAPSIRLPPMPASLLPRFARASPQNRSICAVS